MPPLTQKQMEQYIAIGGTRCPYCESKNISAGIFDEGNVQEVECEDCGERWKDVYTLVRVEAFE